MVAAPAAAGTLTVSSKADSGPGTVRQAIADAMPTDLIKVPKGNYRLSSGALVIDKELVIRGASARKTKIIGDGASRVFEIDPGLSGVTLSKLLVRGGFDPNEGAGINADSPLTLSKVAVVDNEAPASGFGNGGGVTASAGATVDRSLIADNTAYNEGGMDVGGLLTLTNSTVANNVAGNPDFNGDTGAFDAGSAVIVDSTIVGNSCFNGLGCGAGISGFSAYSLSGTIIAGNIAYESNGESAGSPGNPGVGDNCSGSETSLGNNLSDRSGCFTTPLPNDRSVGNPKLGPLTDNGGPTDTIAPKKKSAAVNGGAKTCTSKDQRGVKRPQGKRCDIGAVERKVRKKRKKGK